MSSRVFSAANEWNEILKVAKSPDLQVVISNTTEARFITHLMFDEIKPAIPYKIDETVAADFAFKVLDRFRNPYIRHEWLSISVQYTTKIKMRVIPLLLNYYKIYNEVPACMALGFAAFIRFMQIDGQYTGTFKNIEYKVTVSEANYFANVWQKTDGNTAIKNILGNKRLWDADLDVLPGFTAAVTEQFNLINK